MINIAIIDQNEIHRASLRILLGQIDGFRIIPYSVNEIAIKDHSNLPFDVVLIDDSYGIDGCNKMIREITAITPSVKILILSMFVEDLGTYYNNADVILKSSGKKEFENRIKKLTGC